VEDSATKATLAQTCRVAREALAKRCWPECDLRFGRGGRKGGLDLFLRLGLTHAQLRSLELDVGRMEAGLLRWIAERCDFSALERFEIRTSGGYVHSIVAQKSAPLDVNGAGPSGQSDYGLELVLVKLSAAENGSMLTAVGLADYPSRRDPPPQPTPWPA